MTGTARNKGRNAIEEVLLKLKEISYVQLESVEKVMDQKVHYHSTLSSNTLDINLMKVLVTEENKIHVEEAADSSTQTIVEEE